MILKRFIEKLTPSHYYHSSGHSSSLSEYSQLNSEESSANLNELSTPTTRETDSKQICRLARRLSETAESFDDHHHSADHPNCDSSCPCNDADFRVMILNHFCILIKILISKD